MSTVVRASLLFVAACVLVWLGSAAAEAFVQGWKP